MNIRKHITHKIYWVSFHLIVISLYSASPISVHHSYGLPQLQYLHNSHCLHSHVCYQHSQLLPHPPIHFRHTTLFKSSDHHFWRDLLPSSWATGTVILHWVLFCPQGVRTKPLPRAIQNTFVSNDYSLERVVTKSSLQVCPQAQCSTAWIIDWHPVLNDLQIHPT
jgi:hypothetical protein